MKITAILRRVPFQSSIRGKLIALRQRRASERYRREYRNRWSNPGSVVPSRRNILVRFRVTLALTFVAAVLFVSGLIIGGSDQAESYYVAALLQGAGVFLAIGLAWLFFERHSEHEREREFVGIRVRIVIMRNWACSSITNLTAYLFDVPPRMGQERYGPNYLQQNYQEIRTTLGVGTGGSVSKLPTDFSRDIANFEWIFRNFINLARRCEQAIRLLHPAMAPYPELLVAMDRVQSHVEAERRSWREFIDNRDGRQKELDRWRRGDDNYRETVTEPPFPDELPMDAIANLLAIATAALSLIATITRILEDWDPLPDQSDVTMDDEIVYHGSVGGPNRWGAQRMYTAI